MKPHQAYCLVGLHCFVVGLGYIRGEIHAVDRWWHRVMWPEVQDGVPTNLSLVFCTNSCHLSVVGVVHAEWLSFAYSTPTSWTGSAAIVVWLEMT